MFSGSLRPLVRRSTLCTERVAAFRPLPQSPLRGRSCRRFVASRAVPSTRTTYRPPVIATGAMGMALGAYAASCYLSMDIVHAEEASESPLPGERIEGLPTFSREDVAKHDNMEAKIWVIFRHGVYDVTDFVEGHPGGEKILLAAGSSLEPYWKLYAVHKTAKVFEILEELRIGNLRSEDVWEDSEEDDPYAFEPYRNPSLIVNSNQPFNAEPPSEELVRSFITPIPLFYKRNHFPVPLVNEKEYSLEVSGEGIREPVKLTLDELKTKFPKHNVVSVVQCAGNRRSELSSVEGKPAAKGLNWGNTAIGNAEWGGARLSDVLAYVEYDGMEAEHVHFEGLENYGSSIPINKATDPKNEVLLAYEMNGAPLPRDHGYPVRAVVPGVVGARNVKWVGRVVTSKIESESHWQRKDYKGFNSSTTWEDADFDNQASIQEMPVTASICSPLDQAVAKPGDEITVRGYAHSGGGSGIVRVDVSADGGKTWKLATITASPDQEREHVWGWYLWEAKVSVPEGVEEVNLAAKAVDSHYNVMPERPDSLWNIRGVLSNAWSRVTVKVDGDSPYLPEVSSSEIPTSDPTWVVIGARRSLAPLFPVPPPDEKKDERRTE